MAALICRRRLGRADLLRASGLVAALLVACLAVCGTGTARAAPQLFTILDFQFEDGSVLPDVHIAYETQGKLSPAHDNAILLIPGALGDRHVFAWPVGPATASDTAKHSLTAP